MSILLFFVLFLLNVLLYSVYIGLIMFDFIWEMILNLFVFKVIKSLFLMALL